MLVIVDGVTGFDYSADVRLVSTDGPPEIRTTGGQRMPLRQHHFQKSDQIRQRKRYYEVLANTRSHALNEGTAIQEPHMLRAPFGALTFFKVCVGMSAVGLRLGFATTRPILLGHRLRLAAALVIAMLDAIVPRFVVTEDASSQRTDVKAGSAVNVLDIRGR
jgi:hypothetical protein